MDQNLPLFDVPKYSGKVAGGAFAVPAAARKDVQKLDLRDLPSPPAHALDGNKPR